MAALAALLTLHGLQPFGVLPSSPKVVALERRGAFKFIVLNSLVNLKELRFVMPRCNSSCCAVYGLPGWILQSNSSIAWEGGWRHHPARLQSTSLMRCLRVSIPRCGRLDQTQAHAHAHTHTICAAHAACMYAHTYYTHRVCARCRSLLFVVLCVWACL